MLNLLLLLKNLQLLLQFDNSPRQPGNVLLLVLSVFLGLRLTPLQLNHLHWNLLFQWSINLIMTHRMNLCGLFFLGMCTIQIIFILFDEFEKIILPIIIYFSLSNSDIITINLFRFQNSLLLVFNDSCEASF